MRKILLLLMLLSDPLSATSAVKDKPTTVSPLVYKKLSKVDQQIADKAYQAARQTLSGLLNDVDKGSYEHAAVLRSLSSVYALMNQYPKAAEVLQQCLALDVLPVNQERQAMFNLGQLYLAMEQYAKAVEILQPWLLRNPSVDPELNALMANAYAQLKQFRKALPHIKKAIATSKKPPESWYQLNLALYYELKDYTSAAELLKQLIRRLPDKKEYWQQLSSVYLQLRLYKKAASIQHLAFRKGLLTTEKEILELVNLFLYAGAPYKGAEILKKALRDRWVRHNSKHWNLLANAWQQARELEKAVYALKQASSMNETGELYQQLGQIYFEQEQWSEAIAAFDKALAKGGLKAKGSVYLFLGMCHYELNQLREAQRAFNLAAKHAKQRKSALQWLDYIESAAAG